MFKKGGCRGVDVPPQEVCLAIKLIWASFATTVSSWFLALILPTPPLIKGMAQKLEISVNTFVVLKLVLMAIPAAAIYLVLRQVAKGENWARVVCLIVGIAAVPESVDRFLTMDCTVLQIASAAVNTLYLGFGYSALYLIFTAPGKIWFRKEVLPED